MRADILRGAWLFSEFRKVEENTSNEQKCPLVLHAKPSNKRFIIPLQKNCYFAIGLYFLVRVFTEHPDSVCENDVNNEQNVRAYYMPNL